MKRYKVALHGCDDSTYMFMNLTEEEVKTIQKVSKLSEETSSYQCMPTMEIVEAGEEE